VKQLIERCLQKDPKRRLRDIGDARVELDEKHAPELVITASHTARPRGLALWLAAAALVGGAAISGAWFTLRTPATSPQPIRLSVVPPPGTTFTMRDITEHLQFALSPQGDRLALVAAATGERPRIWIRSFETGAAQPLAGTEGANGLFCSPDGRSLGFQAEGKLKTVSLDGAVPRNLIDLAFDVSHGAWGPDGTILFSSGSGGALMRVPATGGPATQATKLDASRGETVHRRPQFLPDGRFIFFVSAAAPETAGVYLGSLGSGERTQVLRSAANAVFAAGFLFFDPNGVVTRQPFDLASGTLAGAPRLTVEPSSSALAPGAGSSRLPAKSDARARNWYVFPTWPS